MFNPPNKNWNSDDAISLRTFLESETGARLLYHLSEAVPELLGSGDVNAILIRSGEVKGGSALLANLVSLTVEQPPQSAPEKSSHPDLDDDNAFDPITNLPK